MKLYEALPDSVTVNGRRYRLRLDFRNVMRMSAEIARNDVMPEARDYRALRCVMRHPPRDAGPVLAAVRALLFPDADRRGESHERVMDMEQDADLIRAAFWQTYHVNLWRDRLHWFEFSCLLAGLPEGSRYAEVIGIRSRPMPKATKYNAEERKWLAEAKARYALKFSDDEARANYARGVLDVFHALLGRANRGDIDA